MDSAGVPTAQTLVVARRRASSKADGLAAGKGVWVCRNAEELKAGLHAAEALGQPFHVEELLEGEEVSIFALCDGSTALPLPPAQDYKRIGEGDEGANTGGMGSYSPVPRLSSAEVDELVELLCTPVLRELARRRMPFRRRPLRRGHADAGRTEGARVQLPLRRSRDAVVAAAVGPELARGACRLGAR